jgi:peptide/nickel transport system permease protein
VGTYLLKRFLLMLLTLVGMSIIIFMLLRLMPGNIVDIMFDSAGFVDVAEKAAIEKELGLDQPIPVQYAQWMVGLMQWELGYSFVSEMPIVDELGPRIPITAKLAVMALAFSVIFGVPLGVISAVKQDTSLDYVLRIISLSGLSLPSFWLALLILMFFVAAFGTIPIYIDPPESLLDELLLYSIPAAAVGFRSSALIMRLTRSSMLEVLRQDYIRTARSKGASNNSINYHHALKNAVLPVVTIIGIEAAFLIGGLIITETVFNIPGVAHFLVEAILMRDYPIVQNLVMLIALVTVLVNFMVDLTYAVLDPRIKYAD